VVCIKEKNDSVIVFVAEIVKFKWQKHQDSKNKVYLSHEYEDTLKVLFDSLSIVASFIERHRFDSLLFRLLLEQDLQTTV